MILLTEDNFEHRHLSNIIEMHKYLYDKYKVYASKREIADAWEEYSCGWAAGWMKWDSDTWDDRVALLGALGILQLRQDDDYPDDDTEILIKMGR